METAGKLLGHNLPTATSFRKELEIRNKWQDGPIREAVSRALSHSLATAKQYYQAPTISDACNTYNVMQDIIEGGRASSPSQEDATTIEDTTTTKVAAGCLEKGKVQRVSKEYGRPLATPARRCEVEEEGVAERGPKKRRGQDLQLEEEEALPHKTVAPTPPKRRGFTSEQEQLLADYFSQHIATKQYPSCQECRDFIKLYPQFSSRKPKDIYDKCCNIGGR